MNSKRLYFALIGLLVILAGALIGGGFLANSMLEGKAKTLVDLRAKQEATSQEQTELTAAKRDIKTYTDLYNIARVVVPQNKDQTQAVRQIVSLADANHIQLASINFPPSTLGGTATGRTTPAPASASAEGGAGVNLSQLKQVVGIPGVYDLNLIVTSDSNRPCTYGQLISFLSALENNRLTALVSAIDITPAGTKSTSTTTNSSQLSFALTLDIYIKPESK